MRYFVFGYLLLFISCESGSSVNDLKVVTGIDLYDINASPIGRWRTANEISGSLVVYPNPSTGIIYLATQNLPKRLWLVPAECKSESEISETELSDMLNFTRTEIENNSTITINDDNFSIGAAINFQEVDAGFYKLFYELESGSIFWKNLYIDPNKINIPDLNFLDDLCQ